MLERSTPFRSRLGTGLAFCLTATICFGRPAVAQLQTGQIEGNVTRAVDGAALAGALVRVVGTGIEAATGTDGRYALQRVPVGQHAIFVRWLGYKPREVPVTVTAGTTQTVDVALESQPISLGEIVVQAASRAPERVVEAPAAVTMIDTRDVQALSMTAQAPLALASVPGVDVVQSGVNDINLNARGFNSSLNRRVLVLLDGRDLAIALLGNQEWNGLSTPLEDMGRIEMVRGPGSALYGANAFSGVVNITTPTAREIVGTKISLAGGELSTFRGDIRHAGVAAYGQFGYRVNFGYTRSDTWSRSRTAFDSLDLRREYAGTTDFLVLPNIEPIPLNGQSVDPTTGRATGERDDLESIYGSARFDYYAGDGSIGTAEGGLTRVHNEIFVTGIGRVQVVEAFRPWARLAWSAERFNVMAWYSGRSGERTGSGGGQISLSSGQPISDVSNIIHVEGQVNQPFAEDRGRVVLGASFRNYGVNTKATLMDAINDDRNDKYYSAYGQVEYRFSPMFKAVAAARYDNGDLFSAQFSPKAGLVFSPNENHSIRFTFNRAFQSANYSEFFLRAAAGAPDARQATLEAGLESLFRSANGSPLGPLLAGLNLPNDIPWDFSAMTPVLALGNDALDVEKLTGWELGYKGNLTPRVYASVDLYINTLDNFITDLLPGVNPDYPRYLLTDGGIDIPTNLSQLDAALAAAMLPSGHPLRANIPILQAGYKQLADGLTASGQPVATLPDGSRAIVVSYTNAGEVTEGGVELGMGFLLTDEWKLDGSYTFFDFDVKSQQVGDMLLPNTPKHKGNISLSYSGFQGVDFGVTARLVDGYSWAAGVFSGYITATQIFNVNAGYQINNNVRIHAVATNVFDQERFQLYGGSVIGRRFLGGVTATF